VLGVEHTVIEWVDLEPSGRGGEVLIAQVRPKAGSVGNRTGCRGWPPSNALGTSAAISRSCGRLDGGRRVAGLMRSSSPPIDSPQLCAANPPGAP
jgi:hypothetical protein